MSWIPFFLENGVAKWMITGRRFSFRRQGVEIAMFLMEMQRSNILDLSQIVSEINNQWSKLDILPGASIYEVWKMNITKVSFVHDVASCIPRAKFQYVLNVGVIQVQTIYKTPQFGCGRVWSLHRIEWKKLEASGANRLEAPWLFVPASPLYACSVIFLTDQVFKHQFESYAWYWALYIEM